MIETHEPEIFYIRWKPSFERIVHRIIHIFSFSNELYKVILERDLISARKEKGERKKKKREVKNERTNEQIPIFSRIDK